MYYLAYEFSEKLKAISGGIKNVKQNELGQGLPQSY